MNDSRFTTPRKLKHKSSLTRNQKMAKEIERLKLSDLRQGRL